MVVVVVVSMYSHLHRTALPHQDRDGERRKTVEKSKSRLACFFLV
jgi:hypothetical protein